MSLFFYDGVGNCACVCEPVHAACACVCQGEVGGSGVVSGGAIGGSAKNLQHSPLCAFPPAAVPSAGPPPHFLLTRRLLGTPARLPVRVAAAPGGGGEVFEGVRWRAIE